MSVGSIHSIWGHAQRIQVNSCRINNIGTLTVTGGTLGASQVVIKNFDLNRAQIDQNGYLGIKFKEKVAVAAGTNHNSAPFSNGIYSLSDVAAAAKGALQTLRKR
ncbi:hypothetical protein [Ralstonia pseudosolanacearum]